MWDETPTTGALAWTAAGAGAFGLAAASNLDQTMPLVGVLVGISVAGAVVTYAIMVWALIRFRDPRTRGRRYG